MPDSVFFDLTSEDRFEALEQASALSRRPIHILEKDVWVVWALSTLFGSEHGGHLVFKGGTSLSKAYNVIDRFSEDVDLTFDIRAIVPELVGQGSDGIPPNASQEKRWSKEIKRRLADWVRDVAAPFLSDALAHDGLDAEVRVEGDRIFLDYLSLENIQYDYVASTVMLEFGARSTGEPAAYHDVTCDAARFLPSITFPRARPRVMNAGRTFWEKATAVHVFCLTGSFRGGHRFARHWHDIARLDITGHVDVALADTGLASSVVRHKSAFFVEKDAEGRKVDYRTAVSGEIRLVPEGEALNRLAADYSAMVAGNMLMSEAMPFEQLMALCERIAAKVNARYKTS